MDPGAPERSSSNHAMHDPPKVDMWSLGCVLSEFATWVALGWAGVLMYSMLRKSALTALLSRSNSTRRQKADSGRGVTEADYFHDGHEVLKEVTQWHDFLRSILRPTDPLTGPILTIIDKHLLKGNPEHRMASKELCERLFLTVRNVQPRSVPGMTDLIENVFNRANDLQQQEHQNLTRTTSSLDRNASERSKVFLQVPADEGLVVSTNKRYTKNPGKKRPPDSLLARSNSKHDPGIAYVPRGLPRASTGSAAAISPRSSDVNNPLTSFESIFDAHLSCFEKASKKGQIKDQGTKNWLKSKFKRTSDKDRDEMLAEELQDRDLVSYGSDRRGA
jgi:serine/threonine protein kinase